MGFEDEVERSYGRPCCQSDGRSKQTCELTSSIVPRGTSCHRSVELEFPSIGFDPARFSCGCRGLFSGPAERGAVNRDVALTILRKPLCARPRARPPYQPISGSAVNRLLRRIMSQFRRDSTRAAARCVHGAHRNQASARPVITVSVQGGPHKEAHT
jgi:hypothetical protein